MSNVPYLLQSYHTTPYLSYHQKNRPLLRTPEMGRLILYAVGLQAVVIAAWVHFLS